MASLMSYNSKHRHGASIPPFFNDAEETYIHKLVEPSQSLCLGALTKPLEDEEIDIFRADKYFSGRMDEDEARKANLIARRRHQDKKAELLPAEGDVKLKLGAQTPSVYSESSWNSQRAFLRRPRSKAKEPKKKFFANLGCSCTCSDKNSVDIEDYSDDHNQDVRATTSEEPPYGKAIRTSLDPADFIRIKSHQEKERKSLEVFGSSKAQDKGRQSFSLERKLNMLAWDVIPKVEETENQGPIVTTESIKDTESEASSDLFEIECLSCSANPVGLSRHTLDGGDSSCVSPTCYAPSEASVDWSVVTASAADFSIVSDSEEQQSTITATTSHKMLPPRPKRPTARISELPKARYGGILSGCKSQKAVRVAGDDYTTAAVRVKHEKPRVTRSDSVTKMMKFQMDTTQNVGFSSKYRKDLLYIQ